MNFDAGNTSDPVAAQARGSDTVEDREDNSEVMQACILNANEKSEEAVLTVSQIQSPTTDRDNDDLQGATAAIVRSHLHDEDNGTLSFDASGSAGSNAANIPWLESEVTSLTLDAKMPPVSPLGATAAEESASGSAGTIAGNIHLLESAVTRLNLDPEIPLGRPLGATAAEKSLAVLEQRITEACAGFQQVLLELEQLRRRVYQREQWIREERNRERRERRESEMQEGAWQLTAACPLQHLKYRKKVS